MSLERGSRSTVLDSAGKSVVCDEGQRLLVSKDTEGKLMTIESRQAVRRPAGGQANDTTKTMGLIRA